MRRLSLLFAVLFVVPLIGSDSPRDYDDRVKVDELSRKWSPNGRVVPLCGFDAQENRPIDPTRNPPQLDNMRLYSRLIHHLPLS